MGLNLKKTISLTLILLIAPITAMVMSWHWQQYPLNNISQYWFWITETASFPWAILTSAAFFILFCFYLPNKSLKKLTLLWFVLVFAIVAGQLVKSITKSSFAKPRPYVLWMAHEYQIDHKQFYALPTADKKAFIKDHIKDNPAVPNWLYHHWLHETGYSFPSGHALFAATWAFLALLLLNFRKHFLLISAVCIWAILVDISRLKLGMHFPADLVASTFIACIIAQVSYAFSRKWQLFSDKLS